MIELTSGARYEMENPEVTTEREQATLAGVLEPVTYTSAIPEGAYAIFPGMYYLRPAALSVRVNRYHLPVWLL